MKKVQWNKLPLRAKKRQVLVIKLGDKERPAAQEDINDMVETITKAGERSDCTIVTHHSVKFEYIEIPVGEDGKPLVIGKTGES